MNAKKNKFSNNGPRSENRQITKQSVHINSANESGTLKNHKIHLKILLKILLDS